MSVDREQVIQDLKHILIEDLFVEIPEDEIKEEDQFSSIGLDSIGGFELVTKVEDKYNIQIEDEEDLAENSKTVGSFADYILFKLNVN